MATQELAPGGGRFSASGSTAPGNGASTCSARALQVEQPIMARALQVEKLATTSVLQAGTVQPPLGKALGTTHIHPTHLARVKG